MGADGTKFLIGLDLINTWFRGTGNIPMVLVPPPPRSGTGL
jgi:hypothetical protein